MKRILILKYLLVFLLLEGVIPFMERNIFVVVLVFKIRDVMFHNNGSNIPEFLQLEYLTCFLGFYYSALQDI